MKLDADQSILDTLAAKEAENERLKKEKVELTQKLKRLEKEKKEEKSLALAVFESLLDCPVCSYPYIKTRIPMVGTCGHTLCGRCAPLLPNNHCPICRAVGSFRKPVKNFFASEFTDQYKLLKGSQARGNTILIVGGPNIDNEHKSAAVLNSHRTKWIPLDLKLPCQAYSSGVVYLNEEIYLIGGWKNFDALYKLDKKSLEWVQLADMNVGRQWINNSCVALDGYIWVFGGVDESGKPLKSVERYDPKWNKWKQMP